MFWADNNKNKKKMSFGGDYGKDTGSFVRAVKNASPLVVEVE